LVSGNADNTYTFPGSILRVSLSESLKTFDWQLELAAPILLGLPDSAVAPGSQGQLGFGASYFAANSRSRNAAMIFVKQGFIRFNKLGGADGHSLKLGRMEFIDGTEVTPHDANPGGAEAGPHRAPADRQFQFFGCGPKS